MEGRALLVMGGAALVALLVIVAFFLTRTPSGSTTTTVLPSTVPSNTTIYTTTVPAQVPGNTSTVTTTAPQGEGSAWQRFNGDLARFSNVTVISLTYNASMPGTLFSDGANVTLYMAGSNVSFQSYAVLQNFTLPVMVYKIGNSEVTCTNMPLVAFDSGASCETGAVGFPDLINLVSLNAGAYSNVNYTGQSTVNGDLCDGFTATVSPGEAYRITGINSTNSYTASMCINAAYGYPDSYSIGSSAGTASFTYQSAVRGFASQYLNPPADFSLSGATCTATTVSFTFTPFYDMSNPTFAIGAAVVNTNVTGIQGASIDSEMSYILNTSLNTTMLNLINNGTVPIGSGGMQVAPGILGNESGLGSSYDLLNYGNQTFYETLPGNYSAMQSYPVTLPINDLISAFGFVLCDSNGCQAVPVC